jgi:carboxyl-terminal processing protease
MTARGLRALALAVLCAVAGGCSLIDPHNMIGRQIGEPTPGPAEFLPATPTPLDTAARERAFDFVWRTINERYHDPALNGVDWNAVGMRYRPIALAARDDEAFWDVLDKMTGELRDAHTRVESPARVELRKRDESITLGFSFVLLDERLVVTAVNPESDAGWAGLRAGMTVVAIAGEPAREAYEKLKADTRYDSTERSRHLRAVRRLMTGELGSTLAFTFERADGTRFDATLSRRKVTFRPAASHRVLPSGFGYVRLTQWTLGATSRAVAGVEELGKTPGLIVDLRGNPGGSVHAVNRMLERFFPKRTELGHSTTRTGRPVSLLFGTVEIVKLRAVVEGREDAYAGPVVILVNAGSASGSELFAGTMQAVGRAKVVGEPSCGCLLGFLGYARIPGGGELAYSEVGFVMTNGQKIEGEGVVPDHVVAPTRVDLQQNRDRALEEAQVVLRTLVQAKQ